MRCDKTLLSAGVLTLPLYFALLFTAGAFYPDFSHVRQVASELGAPGAPYDGALAFNVGLVVVGCVGIAGAAGLFQGLRKLGAGFTVTLLASAAMASPLATLVMSGFFPLPSPWHTNVYMALAGNFAPALGALAIWKTPNTAIVKVLLLVGFCLTVAAFFGIGDLSAAENAGLRWRLWAAGLMTSVGYLCWVVRARV